MERDLDALNAGVKATESRCGGSLRLDPDLKVPRYHTAVDIHCQPGGYHSEFADEDGLLAVGGRLSTLWLLDAYTHGIFPWPMFGMLTWWTPDPRAVLYPDRLRVTRSLKKTLRQGRFSVEVDTAFDQLGR